MKTKEEQDPKGNEKYSIICQLGKGACGAVYLTRNAENKKYVYMYTARIYWTLWTFQQDCTWCATFMYVLQVVRDEEDSAG